MLRLKPSLAGMRMICPGSHRLLEFAPTAPISDHAIRGTALHLVAMSILKNLDEQMLPDLSDTLADFEGYVITHEDKLDVLTYVKEIISCLREEMLKPVNLNVEHEVSIPQIHKDCRGTIDAWFFSPLFNRVYVFDFKSGFTPVPAIENWQLIEYSLGILLDLERLGYPIDKQCELIFKIVQPNDFKNGAIKTWEITLDELTRVYYPKLARNELLALQDNAPCVTSHLCKTCPARVICPALREAALNMIEYAAQSTPDHIDNVTLSQELKTLSQAKRLIDARLIAIEDEAITRLKRGETVPAYGLKQSSGALRWIASPEQVVESGKLFGVDLKKPLDVLTPLQAQKMGIPEQYLSRLATRGEGKIKLTDV